MGDDARMMMIALDNRRTPLQLPLMRRVLPVFFGYFSYFGYRPEGRRRMVHVRAPE